MQVKSPLLQHIVPVCLLVLFSQFNVSIAQDHFVNVRLLREASPRTIVISSTDYVEFYSGGDANPIFELDPGEKLTITTSNERVFLSSNMGGIYATSLVVMQSEQSRSSKNEPELTIEIADGRSMLPPRKYNGAFKIDVEQRPQPSLRIINELPLENYVVSVLSSEFGFDELEASKALALSIRTLTLRYLTTQSGPEYAVADNESWQAYKGTTPITTTALQATQATMGQVLLYDNELIESVYFASSGGFTANNEDVWNTSEVLPYLRGIEDPFDEQSPHHNWESTLSRSDLLAYLSREYDFQVNDISIDDLNRQDQRVRSIKLIGADNREMVVPGNEFRLLVNHRFGRDRIKSTMFKLNKQPDRYLFAGKGFGHGVGLNQWGALQQSRAGWSHEEIINYYYQGVEISPFLPGMIHDQEAAISNNVPFIDMSEPSPILEDSEVGSEDVGFAQAEALPSTEEGASFTDIALRLYGDDEEGTPEDAGDVSAREITFREDNQGQQRIHADAKIVGWTTTTQPVYAPASSDSLRTKPKRKKTGW